jgi:hypothetical protein
MWTVVPAKYNVITAPRIQASIFNCTYLRCYWRYLDNSMSVILQIWCQIQRTSSSSRYVNCGSGHIQCYCSSAYSGFNVQLKVSALLLQIFRHFDARCTAIVVPSTAHVLQFKLCELWSRTYTMYLLHRIFILQYSTERICAAIADISTFLCALYCNCGAKYSAHPPVYTMWTVVTDVYYVFTAPHIQASIFNWTYLRCYWRYLDNSMSVILQTWWQIQRTSPQFTLCELCSRHIQCIYSSAYSGHNIQLNVSALLLETSRQFNACYTARLVPNTVHSHQFTLCELWSPPYTM